MLGLDGVSLHLRLFQGDGTGRTVPGLERDTVCACDSGGRELWPGVAVPSVHAIAPGADGADCSGDSVSLLSMARPWSDDPQLCERHNPGE